MALRLDRQVQLILLGPQMGQVFGAPTRTPSWGRLLTYNVDNDPSVAGVRPAGIAKVALRYRKDLATRTSFPGTWTPSTAKERAEWGPYLVNGTIRDSFVVDGVIFAITESEQLLERGADRRRYVVLFGQATGTVG